MRFPDELLWGVRSFPPPHAGNVQRLPSKMRVQEQLWGHSIRCCWGAQLMGMGGTSMQERGGGGGGDCGS